MRVLLGVFQTSNGRGQPLIRRFIRWEPREPCSGGPDEILTRISQAIPGALFTLSYKSKRRPVETSHILLTLQDADPPLSQGRGLEKL